MGHYDFIGMEFGVKAFYDQSLHDHKLIMPFLVKEETLKNWYDYN